MVPFLVIGAVSKLQRKKDMGNCCILLTPVEGQVVSCPSIEIRRSVVSAVGVVWQACLHKQTKQTFHKG